MNPNFRQFFDFLSGLPNLNLHISTFRSTISEELANYESSLKLNQDDKNRFSEFITYLNKFYFSEKAFRFSNWEQYSSITANRDISRTTNINESIHG